MTELTNPILVNAPARLLSVQVGVPRELTGNPALPITALASPQTVEEPWFSGFNKQPVTGPTHVAWTNLSGDGQADLSVHGGPDKAILCYPAVHWPHWQTEIAWDQVGPGAFGENFSVERFEESTVCVGDVWQIGTARFQVSQPRQPCWKLGRFWNRPELPKLVIRSGRTGWYLRVLTEGVVEPGQPISLLERPCPDWTIERLNRVRYFETRNIEAAAQLAELAVLSDSWRETFTRRLLGHADS